MLAVKPMSQAMGVASTAMIVLVRREETSLCAIMPAIQGTQHNPLYQSYRSGEQTYAFDVPNGDYAVDAAFCRAQ